MLMEKRRLIWRNIEIAVYENYPPLFQLDRKEQVGNAAKWSTVESCEEEPRRVDGGS